MGSTYSVGKRAAAMVAPNGTIFFALFEQTYEANVYPHHPSWCATYFGTAEACMDRIISHSCDCEGGMLKETGGQTTPSAYIGHWRREMAFPITLEAGVVSAKIGCGIYSLYEENRVNIATILASHGHPGIIDNKVSIDIRKQPELLQEIIDAKNSAWQFLKYRKTDDTSAKSWAAYLPPTCKGNVPEFSVFYIQKGREDREYWVQINGQMLGLGWDYSVMQHLINRFARASEKVHPGSAESVIKALRAEVKKAVPFPMEQRVLIDVSKAEDQWRASPFKHMAKKLGVESAEVLDTDIRAILSTDSLYEFKSMTDGMVSFIGLPTLLATSQQQDLLAA